MSDNTAQRARLIGLISIVVAIAGIGVLLLSDFGFDSFTHLQQLSLLLAAAVLWAVHLPLDLGGIGAEGEQPRERRFGLSRAENSEAFMSSEAMREVLQIIDAKAQSRPTPMEFELAYQARVATDRIRFAIKHTEQFAPQTEQMQEAGLQLLDALQRLETADRRFQERLRSGSEPMNGNGERVFESTAGNVKKWASSGSNEIIGRSSTTTERSTAR